MDKKIYRIIQERNEIKRLYKNKREMENKEKTRRKTPNCPYCGNKNAIKKKDPSIFGKKMYYYICNICGGKYYGKK